MKIVVLVVAAVCLILSIILVNGAYRLFMKIIGADAMFFSQKTKIVVIIVVFMIILSLVNYVFHLDRLL